MAFKISSVFLVVLITLVIYGDEAGAVTSADVKKKITKQNVNKYVGIGGAYGKVSDTVSKDKLIESDHFPPKSCYEYAKDKNIRNIKERDMACVSLPYGEHRILLTTGNANEKAGFFNNWLKDHCSKGQYYEAIEKNIELYAEAKILNQLKKGILDALEVHELNKLITGSQKKALIKKFQLDNYDKNFEKDHDRAEAVSVIHH